MLLKSRTVERKKNIQKGRKRASRRQAALCADAQAKRRTLTLTNKRALVGERNSGRTEKSETRRLPTNARRQDGSDNSFVGRLTKTNYQKGQCLLSST